MGRYGSSTEEAAGWGNRLLDSRERGGTIQADRKPGKAGRHGVSMKLKCQRCADKATLHITEIEADGYREVHLCHKCAQKYLQESDQTSQEGAGVAAESASVTEANEKLQCPLCKLSFHEFRQNGRLGCPHDYEVFRDELRPLLENIHGGLRHIGKVPRRLPSDTRVHNQIIQLRQELQQAVVVEDYERAARIRDEIEALEQRPQGT